jgi:lysozyme family protein
MTSFLDRAIDHLIAVEGGYVNHRDDRGGETNFGVTEAVARQNGYTGAMKDMPRTVAKDIYVRRYWTLPGFDKIATVSEPIAAECLDTGVNMGPAWATMFLQRSLNAFSQNGKSYPMITVDGKCGPGTLGTLQSYMRERGRSNGEAVLLKAMNALQGARYIELTEQRTQNSSFTFGWFNQRIGL